MGLKPIQIGFIAVLGGLFVYSIKVSYKYFVNDPDLDDYDPRRDRDHNNGHNNDPNPNSGYKPKP